MTRRADVRSGGAPATRAGVALVVAVSVAANVGSFLLALWIQFAQHPEDASLAAWKLATAMILITVQALWLIWWRRQPTATMLASLILWQLSIMVSGPDLLVVQPGMILAIFGFASERTGALRTGLTGVAFSVSAFAFACAPLGDLTARVPAPVDVVLSFLWAAGTVLLPAFAGVWYARLRDLSEHIAELSHQVVGGEASRTAAAVSAERRTLAHELHDASSAHLTAIMTLCTAAQAMPLSKELASLIAQISADSRALYQGYERMLGSLQQEDRTRAGAPHPGFRPGQHHLGELPVLVSEYEDTTGMKVFLRVSPAVPEIDRRLGPVRSHTAYRVVQEALNNARKHAGGAQVSVVLTDDGESLLLRVENDSPSPPAEDSPDSTRPGLRLGIAGLRDRLVAAGGSLRAGPRNAGGWAVQALLPHPAHGNARSSSPPAGAVRQQNGTPE